MCTLFFCLSLVGVDFNDSWLTKNSFLNIQRRVLIKSVGFFFLSVSMAGIDYNENRLVDKNFFFVHSAEILITVFEMLGF